MTTSAVPAIRAALFAELQALYPPGNNDAPHVLYGQPVGEVPAYYVAVGTARTAEALAVMATTRPTEEVITGEITFGGYHGDDQKTVSEAVYVLADTFRTWVKANPNIGLAQVQCRLLHVTGSDLAETADEPDRIGTGFYAWLTLTYETNARLT